MNKADKAIFLICALAGVALYGCNKKAGDAPAADNAPGVIVAAAVREGEQIVGRYRELDAAKDSTIKMRALVEEPDGKSKQVVMTIYRKRSGDGSQLMLAEINAPAQERDRAGLIAISPQGEVLATRYVQSNDSFISTDSATGEDSLFGMSLQELAQGQPEKYEWRLAGEETADGVPVYRVEGKLKDGADSKFTRMIMLLSKESGAAVAAEFYDNRNQLQRRVTIERLEQINGVWTQMRRIVDNLARQKKIIFDTLEVRYDRNLNDSIFTREHLKKVSLK